MNRNKRPWYITAGLWLVLLFALIGSIEHVTEMYGRGIVARLLAFATDGGMMLTAYALGFNRHNKKLVFGFWVFTTLSVFANLDSTLHAKLGNDVTWDAIWALDPWQLVKVAFRSCPPLLVWMMTEINMDKEEGETTTTAQPATETTPQPQLQAQPTPETITAPQPTVKVEKPRYYLTDSRGRLRNRKQNRNPPPQPQPVVSQPTPTPTPQPRRGFDPATITEIGFATNTATQTKTTTTAQPATMDDDAREAVVVLRSAGTVAAAGRQLGVSATMIGKRIKKAYDVAPDWVTQQVPDWVARNA